MIRILALAALLTCSRPCPAADGAEQNGPRIRVAISRNVSSLKLRTASRIYVQEVRSGQKYMLLEDAAYDVHPSGKLIAVAGQQLASPIKLLASDGQERIRLGPSLYKGDILIQLGPEGKLDIIEYLSLEDYLYGVLPSEMSPDWPLEALKAQAVASRTYALRNANPSKDYDMTNGVDTQVYSGTSKISPRIIEAVNATRGEVLKYKGKMITAFFHACCGGHTASMRSAWGEAVIKPLYGRQDPFCAPSSHYRWETFISTADLLKFVQRQGSTALRLKGFSIGQKDRSGRALSFKFSTDAGSTTIPAADLRRNFGTFEFRSTYITKITPVKGGFEFSGRGWGHGVGMCQDGAKFMALKGRTYKKILHHYYPGAAIVDND